jgi:phospholipase/lecithinase/hemolysin
MPVERGLQAECGRRTGTLRCGAGCRRMNRRRILQVMLLSGMLASAVPARAEIFTELVVFGDSLSDTGNAGRFSNGPVWVEHLAKSLGLPLRPSRAGGTNHAVGGARAVGGPNELRAQVRGYLAERGGRADPRAVPPGFVLAKLNRLEAASDIDCFGLR